MAQQEAQQTPPQAVEVEFHRVGVAVVKLRGEHDLSSKQALTKALSDASDQLNVLVDLSECTFMDSSVIAAFYVARKSLGARGGRLELVIPPEARTVQRLATISHLAKLVPIHDTHTAAIASFQPGGHSIQVSDLRLRLGDPEVYAAQCS
jgi:anti-anti-sigma factor